MGPIIPAPDSQFRLPLPQTNPNIRKSDAAEKRKRVTPKKRFRPASPRATVTCPPLPQAPPKPISDAAAASAPATVREDTPWPGTGMMSGNFFKERNWLLPKGYLAMEGEKEGVAKPYPKEEGKEGEQKAQSKRRKVWLGTQLPFLQGTKERSWSSPSTGTNGRPAAETLTQTTSKKVQYTEHDQNETAMGTGDREVECKIQP